MHSGELRERVFVERRVNEGDGLGNEVGRWEKVRQETFRANIRPLRGRESEIARADVGTQIYKITIRWTPLVATFDPSHRIVNARTGEAFNIHAEADFTERRRFIEMMCESGTVTG